MASLVSDGRIFSACPLRDDRKSVTTEQLTAYHGRKAPFTFPSLPILLSSLLVFFYNELQLNSAAIFKRAQCLSLPDNIQSSHACYKFGMHIRNFFTCNFIVMTNALAFLDNYDVRPSGQQVSQVQHTPLHIQGILDCPKCIGICAVGDPQPYNVGPDKDSISIGLYSVFLVYKKFYLWLQSQYLYSRNRFNQLYSGEGLQSKVPEPLEAIRQIKCASSAGRRKLGDPALVLRDGTGANGQGRGIAGGDGFPSEIRPPEALPVETVSEGRRKAAVAELRCLTPGEHTARLYPIPVQCGLRGKVEKYKFPGGPVQCKNCFRFGQVRRDCHANPRCGFCGCDHERGGSRRSPPKCLHCSGAHSSVWRGRPACKSFRTKVTARASKGQEGKTDGWSEQWPEALGARCSTEGGRNSSSNTKAAGAIFRQCVVRKTSHYTSGQGTYQSHTTRTSGIWFLPLGRGSVQDRSSSNPNPNSPLLRISIPPLSYHSPLLSLLPLPPPHPTRSPPLLQRRSTSAELESFLAKHRVDVMLLGEPHLRSAMRFSLAEFICHQSDRAGNVRRGETAVMVLCLDHNVISLPPLSHMEATAIQLVTSTSPVHECVKSLGPTPTFQTTAGINRGAEFITSTIKGLLEDSTPRHRFLWRMTRDLMRVPAPAKKNLDLTFFNSQAGASPFLKYNKVQEWRLVAQPPLYIRYNPETLDDGKMSVTLVLNGPYDDGEIGVQTPVGSTEAVLSLCVVPLILKANADNPQLYDETADDREIVYPKPHGVTNWSMRVGICSCALLQGTSEHANMRLRFGASSTRKTLNNVSDEFDKTLRYGLENSFWNVLTVGPVRPYPSTLFVTAYLRQGQAQHPLLHQIRQPWMEEDSAARLINNV
uniref:Uncharacterized protein n=1 Tax=Timema poppense TaxID=170557 RepID=A0A7R9D4T8_TIMPO|nr:unnamed protein product [Timema poppensis]